MRFSLGITFLGDRKKSEQHSKNSDPVKKAGKRTKSDFSKKIEGKNRGKTACVHDILIENNISWEP